MDLFYRTEDIANHEILQYFVETPRDREIVDALKRRTPVVLVGSRGVGKSFLMKVAQAELKDSFRTDRVFPVYVTFNKSTLIQTSDPRQFEHWMLGLLASRLLRELNKEGLLVSIPSAANVLAGGFPPDFPNTRTRVEEIVEAYESSWQIGVAEIDVAGLPTVVAFKDALEDLCDNLGIKRFVLFIDEAAHILLPQQQRQFFTLFRDLRSPYITCHAAVYPGVTAYGSTFQVEHDATMLMLDRDVLSPHYVQAMKDIVLKQLDDTKTVQTLLKHGEYFALLAYAASGNPRLLLKSVAAAFDGKLRANAVERTIREYYRHHIWSEHSMLAERAPAYAALVDWGRQFIENTVLPELKRKNDEYLKQDKKTTCYFWIHRDAPQQVKEALRLLAYTGIVRKDAEGIRATRSEVGTRYAVSLGCLMALESDPATTGLVIARNLTPKRMSEYGANHTVYEPIVNTVPALDEIELSDGLREQLARPIDVLDITDWQKQALRQIGRFTIGDVLRSTEAELQAVKFVGEKRSRRMRNAAIAAVHEYLLG